MENLLEKTNAAGAFGKSVLAQLRVPHLQHIFNEYLVVKDRANTQEALDSLAKLKLDTDVEIAEIDSKLAERQGQALYGPEAIIDLGKTTLRRRLLETQLQRIDSTTPLLQKHLAGSS